MHQKPPFKILGSSDWVVAQKSLIFIFVRVIISPETSPRKPVSILRVEARDFKLLKHIKLLVTDNTWGVKLDFIAKPAHSLSLSCFCLFHSRVGALITMAVVGESADSDCQVAFQIQSSVWHRVNHES